MMNFTKVGASSVFGILMAARFKNTSQTLADMFVGFMR